MKCEVFQKEVECSFASAGGCSFNGGKCHPAVEACEGCDHIREIGEYDYCSLYGNPAGKWAYGSCASASHLTDETPAETKKLNPLKASKRGVGRG